MYSKIPMGKTEWTEDNMRYSMCFVPLIGMLVGMVEILWFLVYVKTSFNNTMYACGAVLLPLLITGGIHMDGYCDVVDALSSYGDMKKKLDILKDPHVGAFAIMWVCAYFIALVGCFSEIHNLTQITIVALGYVLSRSLTCLLSMIFKNARKEGTLYAFSSKQDQGIVSMVLAIYIIMACVAMFLCSPLTAVLVAVFVIAFVLYFRNMIYRNFGGITGDMAGFLIQMLELICLLAVVIGSLI